MGTIFGGRELLDFQWQYFTAPGDDKCAAGRTYNRRNHEAGGEGGVSS